MNDPTLHEDRRPEGLTGVLDALVEAVSAARAMPMSSSVLVSRAELLDLVEQARAALPTQLSRADEVLAEADDARARARQEAERIEDEARRRAAALVEEQAVVAQARERAEQIVREADEQARVMRRDADDYCDRRLADFEIDLGKVLGQVQAGRAKLAGRLDGAPGHGAQG
jgi:cell division septum initiation protein DivIVA